MKFTLTEKEGHLPVNIIAEIDPMREVFEGYQDQTFQKEVARVDVYGSSPLEGKLFFDLVSQVFDGDDLFLRNESFEEDEASYKVRPEFFFVVRGLIEREEGAFKLPRPQEKL